MIKKILAIQTSSIIADIQGNFSALELYLADIFHNADVCPDFLFLPEVWSVGWYPKCFKDCADSDLTLEFLSNLARKYSVNIFGGSLSYRQNSVRSPVNLFLAKPFIKWYPIFVTGRI